MLSFRSVFLVFTLFVLSVATFACAQPAARPGPDVDPSTTAGLATSTPISQVTPDEVGAQAKIYPTITNQPSLASCLIGEWVVVDLEQAIAESYSRLQSPLRFQSIEGDTRYSFDDQGGLQIRFNELVVHLSGVVDGKEMVARTLMNGTANAEYQFDDEIKDITLSGFGGDGIMVTTEINGQVLAQGDLPAWMALTSNLAGGSAVIPNAGPARVVQEAHTTVACSGDELTLQATVPVAGPEINLRRIIP